MLKYLSCLTFFCILRQKEDFFFVVRKRASTNVCTRLWYTAAASRTGRQYSRRNSWEGEIFTIIVQTLLRNRAVDTAVMPFGKKERVEERSCAADCVTMSKILKSISTDSRPFISLSAQCLRPPCRHFN